MVKKITISDMIDRFGKRRILRALTKRRFRNKRRTEERKTGQKNMGFKKGGKVEEGLLIMIEEKRKGGQARKKLSPQGPAGRKGISPKKKPKTQWEKKQELRKKSQATGYNMIFADEWDKIDPGLKKHMFKFNKGGMEPRPKRKYPERKQISVKEEIEKRMKKETPRTYKIAKGKLGMLRRHLHKQRIKKELKSRPEHLSKPKVKLAGGGINKKSTLGELQKKYGSLKKGIRLKGRGSSFIEEYKKRVYGRSKGGSMVQGPMKRARGSGAAIKGTRFQGTF
jgi:hypothetical protein